MDSVPSLADSAQRNLLELASIFAAGILRLQKQGRLPDRSSAPVAQSLPTCLEVPPETVLSVTTLVDGFRDPETRSKTWR